MTIAQYVRLLREQWIVVALLALLGALGAGTYSALATPQYQAETQLFVSTSGQSDDLSQLSQGSTFTQARVKSYTDLLTSPQVLAPVIKTLDLDTTPGRLAQQVSATNPLDTILLDVTVTDTSPTRAADIANAIAAQFPAFVDALETPARQAVSPVKVTPTRLAVVPTAPVSPRKSLNLALGLLVGLGLGVGVAVLRDSLDRTVNSRTQLSQLASAPILGAVGDDPTVSATPLITHDAFSPRAEAFRQLRTNIRFLSVDHRVDSLVVTGSVQAEGKTTTAANIAIALAQSGSPVALIDADLRRPSIADLFGLPGGIGLTSVLLGDVPLAGALQRWSDDLPLDVLTAGPPPPNPSELIGSSRMADLIHQLTSHGITVIVDSPPLLPVTDAAVLARITDGALLVTRVGSTRQDQFMAAVDALQTAGAPILGVVLNRVPRRRRSSHGGGYGYDAYRYVPDPSAGRPVPAAPDPDQRTSGPGPVMPVAVTVPPSAGHLFPSPLPPAHAQPGPTILAVDRPAVDPVGVGRPAVGVETPAGRLNGRSYPHGPDHEDARTGDGGAPRSRGRRSAEDSGTL